MATEKHLPTLATSEQQWAGPRTGLKLRVLGGSIPQNKRADTEIRTFGQN